METAAQQWDLVLTRSNQIQSAGAIAQLGERLHGINPLSDCPIRCLSSRNFELRNSGFVFSKRSPDRPKKMI